MCDIGKKRWGHLVEWVDKASFTRLNKLFKINAFERAYKVLISNKNLLALIGNPKSFISPIFHCLALPSLVLDEHFVLKDLPFYKIARLADSEAHQAHLEEREKKRQEWTLRQVSIAGRPSSNSLSGLPLKRGRNLLLGLSRGQRLCLLHFYILHQLHHLRCLHLFHFPIASQK